MDIECKKSVEELTLNSEKLNEKQRIQFREKIVDL